MRLQLALIAAAFTATAAQAASVEITDAVARVTVIPEDRSDIRVEVVSPNAQLPLSVRTVGDRTIIDGDLDRRIRGCSGSEKGRIRVRGVGDVSYDEMPHVVIHTPRAVQVQSDGAVKGVIGRSASLSLRDSGCSSWAVADVAGEAVIRESGAGSIRMGQSNRLDLHLSGAASIHATRVRENLDASLSGAGGVRIGDLAGAMQAHVSGVGQIKVDGGQATSVRASVSGVGGVEFGGVAANLDASISGIGNVQVKEVTGSVTKSVSGMGRVRIG
jgi:hypothetical protein